LTAVKKYEHILTALCEQYWKNYVPVEGVGGTLPPVTDRLRTELVNQHNISLSPRQAEVALYILQGHSSLSISLNLDISKETVKVFRKQLYAKCNISSQAELFALLMPIFSILWGRVLEWIQSPTTETPVRIGFPETIQFFHRQRTYF